MYFLFVFRDALATLFELETEGEMVKRGQFCTVFFHEKEICHCKNDTSRVFCSSCVLLITDYALGEADGSELCR